MQNAEDQPVISKLSRSLDLLQQVIVEGSDVSVDHSSHFLFDGSELYFEVGVVKAFGLPAKVENVSLEGNGTERLRLQWDGSCLAGLLGKKLPSKSKNLLLI